MPNPVAVALHLSLPETASGMSAAIDLADRTYSQLTLDCTALTGTAPTLDVTIETSVTGTQWRFIKKFDGLTALGTKQLSIPQGDRFIRAKWIIGGTTPSATFTILGTAYQLYVLPSEIPSLGLPRAALEGVTQETLAEKCLGASDEAAGYLDGAYTLPLITWDSSLRKHVAAMAVFDLMRVRGYDPDSGKDMIIKMGRDDALTWLNRIANGKLRPTTIVDTTPLIRETEVAIEGGWSRGWSRFPWV
jgi:phage gp36-like protein